MTAPFASRMRMHLLQEMEQAPLDLLIIGGGITGSGIALDAAARGMRVGLVDMQDYAAGTSSRSTKLVHGGLRYLKQFDIGVVAEVGKERAIVYENGPHVTTPEWMLLPIYKEGTFGRFSTSLGLRVYDFLAGVKREERRRMLSAAQTLAKEPLLRREGLEGGGYYVEYRTDDARLTLEVLKEAAAHGALAVNYARLERFDYEAGQIAGAEIADVLSGRQYTVRARCIVNAAGPWVDTLRQLDGSQQGKRLLLTKGIHLVVDQSRFPLRQAVYFDTPDGRMLFAIPRDGKTYVGTTDTEYTGDMAHPRMTERDRQYVLDAVNGMFPELRITTEDIESSWAGIRPLIFEEGKGPSEISRRDEIWQSESGLITIAGGKLTGYRKMAETVVDRVAAKLEERDSGTDGDRNGRVEETGGFRKGASSRGVEIGSVAVPVVGAGGKYPPCRTKELPISGGHVGGAASFQDYVAKKTREGTGLGLPRELAAKWAACYGSNVDRLFELVREMGNEPKLPREVSVPLRYAMEHEMAVTLEDFFVRRTGALLFDIDWVRKWKGPAAAYMASYLGWSADEQARYAEELEKRLHEAIVPEDAVDG
ncbi:glycerol-3-phosphate dehydrogenase/oxidase [Paenibacillus humicus]|uniref:glycerol-3-phosphate dehydrogenase/oxidase n=1 Tax=Paenibacillus humicus TaxID=412861 RepID=UPI003D273EC2